MKKVVFGFALLCMGISFGQVKTVRLTDEEVNLLGNGLKNNFFKSLNFNAEIVEKLKLKNTLSYYVEFKTEGKIINQTIVPVYRYISYGNTEYNVEVPYSICFNMKDISTDIAFSLMKENWIHSKGNENEEFICNNHNAISLFQSQDNVNFKMNNLLDGKIEMILYRLEN